MLGGFIADFADGLTEGGEYFVDAGLGGNGFDPGGFKAAGEDGQLNGLGFGALAFEVVGNEFEFDAVARGKGVMEGSRVWFRSMAFCGSPFSPSPQEVSVLDRGSSGSVHGGWIYLPRGLRPTCRRSASVVGAEVEFGVGWGVVVSLGMDGVRSSSDWTRRLRAGWRSSRLGA